MEIIKRSGSRETFTPEKITRAMAKSFAEGGPEFTEETAQMLLQGVEEKIAQSLVQEGDESCINVERIQDMVEETLMEHGFYQPAKRYILYRQKRSELRAVRRELVRAVAGENEDSRKDAACTETLAEGRELDASEGADSAAVFGKRAEHAAQKKLELDAFEKLLRGIQRDFPGEEYSLSRLLSKYAGFLKADMDREARLDALVKAAVELTSQEATNWENIAARFLDYQFHTALRETLLSRGIHSFYEKLRYLTDEGLYGSYILEHYSRAEIDEAEHFLDNERDKLLNYSGLDLMLKRYVIHTHTHVPLETPQEMFLGIALHLAMEEKTDRLGWVKRFYDMLSKLEVTMATPTTSNARKPYHQLSSCFIDTVPDSLKGIFRSVDNFAMVSKFGGGMGLYFGKVRAKGGSIRGFEGAAGGVIRWIRIVNDTAVAVDQLGMRQGAVAVYLDVWHKDLPEFLNLRTNNGDDRMKAHDVFPAVCYPDLFWKMAKEDLNQDWHMMCPHDILVTKGYALEDYYGEEWEKRYLDCVADPRIDKRSIPIKEVVRLILKSAVETGTPFTFNRDIVNRANPNSHEGMIYCSNLCTEIAQNMRPIESVQTEIKTENGDTVIVNTTRPGDFVVCNLASLSLGRLPVEDEVYMQQVVATAVRALDNVIDLNFYPVPYAKVTNRRWRAIGLGCSGYHHMLAKHGIAWESEKHLAFVDRVFETINYAAISASAALAKEKGSYQFFEGSDWQTGAYFEKRGYTAERWQALKATVAESGMRNGWLLAIAPTGSTSILAGTTAGVDPVMNKFFLEEKKGSMLPRVAPELSPDTYWYYKNAHYIDQSWSVRAAGVRQRHIDQAQSMNLYITNDYTLRQVLNLYIEAWEYGVKTIYYVRSKSLEVEECESCSA